MKEWSDLVAAALLGTARAPLPAAPAPAGALGSLLGRLAAQTPERRLLASAALLSLWVQAGARPQAALSPLPPPAPAGERDTCPSEAAQHLGEILRGEMGPVLGEWLAVLAQTGRVLPHCWLPELLDLAHARPPLRPLVLVVLGARGTWLAAQNPDWRDLVVPDGEAVGEAWQTSTREERLALLAHLRATDPARARELLAATWEQESPADRAAFLETWSTGLSPTDEPFLEQALDDRRQEVRTVAAGLLARLGDSRLVRRMDERVRGLFALERGFLGRTQLALTPPQACDAAMARDGIRTHPPRGVGQQAWWLYQVASVATPAAWPELTGRTPGERLRWAAGTGYEGVLLEAWARLAARRPDPAWAEALLGRWAEAPWSVTPSGNHLSFLDDLEALLGAVPQERLEAWLACCLRGSGRLLDHRHSPLVLLERHRRPWSDALTRAVLEALRGLAGRPYQDTWPWQQALPALALSASPALAGEAERGWPPETPWKQAINRFLAILRFRRAMLQALRGHHQG